MVTHQLTAQTTRLALILASWFGSGYAPKAPGTVGSLAALPLVLPLLYACPPVVVLSIGVALLIAGAWAAGIAGAAWGQVDHGAIVIDEVVGMLVAAAIPFYLLNQWIGPGALAAVSFLAFRVFDIAKPWPISLLDRRLKNGWGVMVDDVAAGMLAGTVTASVLAAAIAVTL